MASPPRAQHLTHLLSLFRKTPLHVLWHLSVCTLLEYYIAALREILESPLYVVDMFYYHWLIKKLLRTMTGQNKARQEIQTEIYRERQ